MEGGNFRILRNPGGATPDDRDCHHSWDVSSRAGHRRGFADAATAEIAVNGALSISIGLRLVVTLVVYYHLTWRRSAPVGMRQVRV
jgi:hypothetical protein